MKNGFLGAIYDSLEATVDTLVEAVRGYPSSEAALRADAREDRALIRTGHDPDDIAERRDRLESELWDSAGYDLTFTRLRESGWRSADIELAIDRDGFDINELTAGRPEDFGFESTPSVDGLNEEREAPSSLPRRPSGAFSLTSGDPHDVCSLTEPTPCARDLGYALER